MAHLSAGLQAARARGVGPADLRDLDPGEREELAHVHGARSATFAPHGARIDPARLASGPADAEVRARLEATTRRELPAAAAVVTHHWAARAPSLGAGDASAGRAARPGLGAGAGAVLGVDGDRAHLWVPPTAPRIVPTAKPAGPGCSHRWCQQGDRGDRGDRGAVSSRPRARRAGRALG